MQYVVELAVQNVVDCHWQDPILVANHRVCLACTGLSVRQDTSTRPGQHGLQDGFGDLLKDELLMV